MRLLALLVAIPAIVVLSVACGGDNGPSGTPTGLPSIAAPTEAPDSPTPPPATAEPSATSAPAPTATTASSPTPTDGTVFPENPGSTDPFPMKSNPDPSSGIFILNDVRVGAHPESGGWDRIVFQFEDVPGQPGAHPGGIVEYVDEASACASGMPIALEGGAILRVRLDSTQAHDDNGQLTIDSTEIDGPGNSILQAKSFCDFEGVVGWVIGVPQQQNFKVAFLDNPSRIVIDVKWP
jgi:hypothetical protein